MATNNTVNRIELIGYMGAMPKLRFTTSGAPVTNFSIATNRVWKGQDGEQQRATDWHRVYVTWNMVHWRPVEHPPHFWSHKHERYMLGALPAGCTLATSAFVVGNASQSLSRSQHRGSLWPCAGVLPPLCCPAWSRPCCRR